MGFVCVRERYELGMLGKPWLSCSLGWWDRGSIMRCILRDRHHLGQTWLWSRGTQIKTSGSFNGRAVRRTWQLGESPGRYAAVSLLGSCGRTARPGPKTHTTVCCARCEPRLWITYPFYLKRNADIKMQKTMPLGVMGAKVIETMYMILVI